MFISVIFHGPLVRKLTAATPWQTNLPEILPQCPNGIKEKSEILETPEERVLEF